MPLTIRNWEKFQHYKQRRPPWIKLHRELLDDVEYRRLPVASRALAPDLWLLASEAHNGVIMLSDSDLAYRLRLSEGELSEGLMPLIEKGFAARYQHASTALASCKQDATPETEKSRDRVETETEGFDGQKAFEEFCELYPMPDRSSRAQTAFWQAVQGIGKRRSLDDSSAFLWLKQRTAAYLGAWSLQPHTMLKFLETGVYDWEDSAWETEKDHKRISTGMRREYKATPEEEAKYEELRKKYAAAGKP